MIKCNLKVLDSPPSLQTFLADYGMMWVGTKTDPESDVYVADDSPTDGATSDDERVNVWNPSESGSSAGPCFTTATWRCRKIFSQWERSFLWKLRSHWLKGLRQSWSYHCCKTGPRLAVPVILNHWFLCLWWDIGMLRVHLSIHGFRPLSEKNLPAWFIHGLL